MFLEKNTANPPLSSKLDAKIVSVFNISRYRSVGLSKGAFEECERKLATDLIFDTCS